MSWGYVAVGAGIAVSGYLGSESAKDAAATSAAGTAAASSAIGKATALGREDIASGYDQATQAYLDSISGATKLARAGIGTTEQYLSPYATAGTDALQQQVALTGAMDTSLPQLDYGTFEESAGQKFLRERQEQSLLRNQAAIGGLGGGNVRTALQEQAYGIASQQEESWYARQMQAWQAKQIAQQQQLSNYGALATQGATASSNIASGSLQEQQILAGILERSGASLADLYAGKGTALGNIAIGSGTQQAGLAQAAADANAAGTLGQSAAYQNSLQSLAMLYGDYSSQTGTTGTTTSPSYTTSTNDYTTSDNYIPTIQV